MVARSPRSDVSWAPLVEEQSTNDVQAARDAADWLLDHAARNPGGYDPGLLAVLRRVRDDAASALAARRVASSPTSLRTDLDAVKRRLNLVGFVRHRAPFAEFEPRANGRLVASCPFGTHRDSDPSFTIYPDGHFYCFGCHKGGTVVDFELWWSGDSLREVIDRLRWEAGIATPVPGTPSAARRLRVREARRA